MEQEGDSEGSRDAWRRGREGRRGRERLRSVVVTRIGGNTETMHPSESSSWTEKKG